MRERRSVERWEVGAAAWEMGPPLRVATLGASLLSGADGEPALAAGLDAWVDHGADDDPQRGLHAGIAQLDAATLEWNEVARVSVRRYLQTAVALGAGRWLLAGGLVFDDERCLAASRAVDLVDLAARQSRDAPPLPFATSEAFGALLPGGRVLVAGGTGEDEPTTECAIFDPATGGWAAAPALPRGRAGVVAAASIDDRYAVWVGGLEAFDGVGVDTAMVFDAQLGRWDEIELPVLRDACVVALPNTRLPVSGARLLVSGGYDASGEPTADVALVTLSASEP